MKKVFVAVLSIVLASVLFTGCSSASSSASSSPSGVSSASSPEASAVGDKLKIGVVQIMEHPSLNTIRESFLEELAALGYDESKVEIDYQNAQNDQSALTSINQKFVSDGVDLIVAIATPSAQSAAASTKDIPIVFSAVTDPIAAKLMTDINQPDGNVTGTSDAIPVEQVFELSKKLTPDVETFGFLYCTSEVSAMSVIEEAKAYCDANGIPYTEATISNTSELQQAAQSLVGKCDAFYVSIDNTIASAMPTLVGVANQAKIPLYVGADSMVIDGGLATVGIEYTNLGKQTAAMAAKVLEGTPISEIPVETLDNFGTVINQTTADSLGIAIPDEVKASAQIVE